MGEWRADQSGWRSAYVLDLDDSVCRRLLEWCTSCVNSDMLEGDDAVPSELLLMIREKLLLSQSTITDRTELLSVLERK